MSSLLFTPGLVSPRPARELRDFACADLGLPFLFAFPSLASSHSLHEHTTASIPSAGMQCLNVPGRRGAYGKMGSHGTTEILLRRINGSKVSLKDASSSTLRPERDPLCRARVEGAEWGLEGLVRARAAVCVEGERE